MKLIIDISEDDLQEVKEYGIHEFPSLANSIQNGIPLEEELEKIKAEIQKNRDEWIKGQDAEWHTYDRCLNILDKHIKENEK